MFAFEFSGQGQSTDSVCFLFVPASTFNGFSQTRKNNNKDNSFKTDYLRVRIVKLYAAG